LGVFFYFVGHYIVYVILHYWLVDTSSGIGYWLLTEESKDWRVNKIELLCNFFGI